MATYQTLQQVFLTLSAAYEHPLSESTVAVYAAALADIDDETLKQATTQHLSRNRFFPRISELRALALREAYPEPIEAWGIVLVQIQTVGSYGTPRFPHPLIAKCVQALGWRTLCQSDLLAAERARFIQAYEAHVQRAQEAQVAFPTVSPLQIPETKPAETSAAQVYILPSASQEGTRAYPPPENHHVK